MTRRLPPDPDTGAPGRPGAEPRPPDTAAAWVVRMDSDQRTRQDEEALRDWLRAHPEAARDCAAQRRLWDGVAALAEDPEARALLRGMHTHAHAAPRRRFGRRAAFAALFGVAAAAVLAIGFAPSLIGQGDLHRTAPGEQRRVTLADGSSVTLNTDTRLRASFDEAERRLVLERGQAYFEVAKDAARPFRVFVGDDEVRAIGTAFEIRKEGQRARVVLEQGVVAIYRNEKPAREFLPRIGERNHPAADAAAANQPAAILRAGQQASLGIPGPIQVESVDLRPTQAWRYGRMVLDATLLGDAVAEINRYGGRQIVLADPALAQIRVSGVFHTARPEALVELVTATFPVRVARNDKREILLAPR